MPERTLAERIRAMREQQLDEPQERVVNSRPDVQRPNLREMFRQEGLIGLGGPIGSPSFDTFGEQRLDPDRGFTQPQGFRPKPTRPRISDRQFPDPFGGFEQPPLPMPLQGVEPTGQARGRQAGFDRLPALADEPQERVVNSRPDVQRPNLRETFRQEGLIGLGRRAIRSLGEAQVAQQEREHEMIRGQQQLIGDAATSVLRGPGSPAMQDRLQARSAAQALREQPAPVAPAPVDPVAPAMEEPMAETSVTPEQARLTELRESIRGLQGYTELADGRLVGFTEDGRVPITEEQAALLDQAFEGGTTVAGREGGTAQFQSEEQLRRAERLRGIRDMREQQLESPAIQTRLRPQQQMTPAQRTRAAVEATGGGETDPQGRPIGPGTEARERASAERERRIEERADFNQARRSQTAETRRFRELAESEGLTGRAAEIRGGELASEAAQAAEDRDLRRQAQEAQIEATRAQLDAMKRNAARIENQDARQATQDALRSLQQDRQTRARVAGETRQFINSEQFYDMSEEDQNAVRDSYKQILLQSIADVTGGPIGGQVQDIVDWLANNSDDPRAAEIARDLGLEDFIQ